MYETEHALVLERRSPHDLERDLFKGFEHCDRSTIQDNSEISDIARENREKYSGKLIGQSIDKKSIRFAWKNQLKFDCVFSRIAEAVQKIEEI